MKNKNIFELLSLMYYIAKFLLLHVVFYKKVIFQKIPLIYGSLNIRGKKWKIDIYGSSRLKVLGNVKVIFDDVDNVGHLKISSNSIIESGVSLSPRGGNILIDENVFVGPNVLIQAYKNSDIFIGKNVMIAKDTSIFSTNHVISNPLDGYRSENGSFITIEDDVWIGANCVITAGITIGKGSVIGANSVVTKNIPEYCIAVGNPAKIIKQFDFDQNKWIKYEK